VQFSAAYPDIAKVLKQYLTPGTNNEIALNAIASFAWLVQRTANAWQVWQNDRRLYNTLLDSTEYHFVITQRVEKVNDV
jgi:hypothetical protein